MLSVCVETLLGFSLSFFFELGKNACVGDSIWVHIEVRVEAESVGGDDPENCQWIAIRLSIY